MFENFHNEKCFSEVTFDLNYIKERKWVAVVWWVCYDPMGPAVRRGTDAGEGHLHDMFKFKL